MPQILLSLALIAYLEWLLAGLVYRSLALAWGPEKALVLNLVLLLSISLWGLSRLRRQGARAMQALQAAQSRGQSPTAALSHELMMLLANVLLCLPGYLSTVVALLLLLPPTRALLKKLLGSRLARWQANASQSGAFRVIFRPPTGTTRPPPAGDIIDVDAIPHHPNSSKPGEPPPQKPKEIS